MRNKRKYGLLIISIVILTSLITGFIQLKSIAAGLKSPDLNDDKVVNMADVILLAGTFNTVSGDGKYKAQYDLNNDSVINMSDVIIIASQFNTIIISSNTPSPTPIPTPTPSPSQIADSEKILIPHKSWTCGMADGIPKPENGLMVLEANIKLDQIYSLGKTQYGQRQVFVVQSGSVTGPKISGSIM
ncbi:MAG: dockerin type I domain-containing protein, partial [Bacillota bacterium]|nr:dockerin type I domain-containing protein [Bacillota bacterium]